SWRTRSAGAWRTRSASVGPEYDSRSCRRRATPISRPPPLPDTTEVRTRVDLAVVTDPRPPQPPRQCRRAHVDGASAVRVRAPALRKRGSAVRVLVRGRVFRAADFVDRGYDVDFASGMSGRDHRARRTRGAADGRRLRCSELEHRSHGAGTEAGTRDGHTHGAIGRAAARIDGGDRRRELVVVFGDDRAR